ncbi:MAG: trypsin-like peptidase domain-containing protein [Clostridiales bacterium]|nr:trypsin-like peptidase domain-containing protein [Clostridiales bacterium]
MDSENTENKFGPEKQITDEQNNIIENNQSSAETAGLFDNTEKAQKIDAAGSDDTIIEYGEDKGFFGKAENDKPVQNIQTAVPVLSSRDNEKKKLKKFIVLVCVVCALAGGIIGGVISGLAVKSSVSASETTAGETTAAAENSADSVVETAAVSASSSGETTTASVSASAAASSDNGTSSSSSSSKSALTAAEIYKQNVNSVVSIESVLSTGKSYGTGFIVSSDGYIVTNYHVVSSATGVNITLYDDSEYKASIVGYEENNDIAVLKIEPETEISCVTYGLSSNLSVGDTIYIIGNPLGDLTFTFTSGIVSALNRLIAADDGMTINMFQTDAAVNSGNSGGPVFNAYGNVVGIASAKYASSSIEGLGFCIPIDDVSSMINEIIEKGYVSGKPLMGISVYDTVTSTYGFLQSVRSINGAKVAAVGTNSAAVNSGIAVDDIITAVNGEAVSSVSSLKTILTSYRSGDTVTLTVYRGESEITLQMTFDEYEPTSSTRTSYSNVYDL